jgi:hypothetical protein
VVGAVELAVTDVGERHADLVEGLDAAFDDGLVLGECGALGGGQNVGHSGFSLVADCDG